MIIECRMRGLLLASFLVLSLFVAEAHAVIGHAEFKKKLLNVNPGNLTPQCKKVFKACSMKMFSLMSLLDVLKNNWGDFVAIDCVKTMLEEGFPNYSKECTRSGGYGNSIRCMLSPPIMDLLDKPHRDGLSQGLNCLLDNSMP